MRLSRSVTPLVLLLLIFVVGVWFIALQWETANANRLSIDRSHRVIETSITMVKEMVDAETGQRGYLITGDEAFLGPLQAAQISMPERFAQLRLLGANTGSHEGRVDALEALWKKRLALIQASVEAVRGAGGPSGRDLSAEAEGRSLMDQIRAEAARLQSAETTLLTERLAASDRSRDRLALALSGLVLMAGIGMAYSIIALSRRAANLVRDVQSQRQISRSLEEATFELAGEVTSVRAELNNTALRFNAALRSAPIVIASQDRELRYLWMRNSILGHAPDWFIGRTDGEVMPEPARSRMIEYKRDALSTGEPRDFEILLGDDDEQLGRWYDVHVEPTRDDKGAIDGVTTVAIEVSERKRRERHVRLLMRELAHRSKNTLAVTQAVARQTAANCTTIEEFLDRFAERLEALARAHSLLVNEGWAGASLADLARSQLAHYADRIGQQVFMSGPPLTFEAEATQHIGLALHELATNAAKYGALSNATGRVDLTWELAPGSEGSRVVTLRWEETGGPPVSPPARRGFGHIVIERTVARAVGGDVELSYRLEGLVWVLRFTLPPALPAEAAPHSAAIS